MGEVLDLKDKTESKKKDVVKVLSIDFDYIMFPWIKTYNDLCVGDENPTCIWKMIEQLREVEDKISYDANALNFIYEIIVKNVLSGAKFHSIDEHQYAANIIMVDYFNEGKDTELFNMDFHHDFMYRPTDKAEMIDFDDYNCSNWIGYLYYKKILTGNIKWISPANADPYNGEDADKIERINLNFHKDQLLEEKFDCVILCFSPQWVPYKYRHLFDNIVNMARRIEETMSTIKNSSSEYNCTR